MSFQLVRRPCAREKVRLVGGEGATNKRGLVGAFFSLLPGFARLSLCWLNAGIDFDILP